MSNLLLKIAEKRSRISYETSLYIQGQYEQIQNFKTIKNLSIEIYLVFRWRYLWIIGPGVKSKSDCVSSLN